MKLRKLGIALVAAAGLVGTGVAQAQERLIVWFTKGFYQAEDVALDEVVKKFEQKTGVKVELSRYAVQEIIPKTVAALDAGNPPDVAFGHVYDFQVTSKWAFEGRLEDISDVLGPMKGNFLPNTLETVYLYNDKAKKKAHYAFVLEQQTMHIQYWKDMLAEAGFKPSDIPGTWKEYWSFWCDKVQPAYRQKTGKRIYAIGNPMGVDGTDSFFSFLTFADAYNAKIVDDNGKLVLDDPKNRAALVNAMRDYTGLLTRGCSPPSSTAWKDPDNNVAFHNKTIIMTHNATISIASKWLDDSTNSSLTAEQRAQAKKNYEELIATAAFPKKPDGSPMTYRAAVKTGFVFEAAKNKRRAKEFVAFLMQDENAIPFVEGALGRWYPVTKSGAARLNFWLSDPHRSTVQQQFVAGTNPFEFTKNWKFTIVNNENVWAKAMNRVVNDKVPVEKAVDEMIARIKQLAG
ncbi:MAG TPA: ABC transporter substrate-binding protein [Casimicrobiaceae bacterium]|nr:ABC transporter substrate-binding protein [Casimicrobiaceae bacterium]